MRRDVEDLFDVFEPWTDVETEPWEPPAPPPPPSPALRPVPRRVGSLPHVTADGAIEPATVVQTPPSMTQPRRRVGPRIAPPAVPSPSPDPATAPADFLRTEGIAEVARARRRMEAVDHKVMIQDLLDLPQPALRVLFWPRPGAMRATQDRISATLELVVSNDEPECREVVARYWVGDPPVDEASLGSIPVDTLDLAWVRGRVLDFIEAILARA